jgi:hypothetical protein
VPKFDEVSQNLGVLSFQIIHWFFDAHETFRSGLGDITQARLYTDLCPKDTILSTLKIGHVSRAPDRYHFVDAPKLISRLGSHSFFGLPSQNLTAFCTLPLPTTTTSAQRTYSFLESNRH